MRTALTLFLGIALGAAGFYGAQTFLAGHSASQPYAGQDQRVISSLSPKDIDQLKKGAGWGLAKPAEFNGYPGPAHVLEFADKLDLTNEQKTAIQSAFNSMNAKARQLGIALIDAEAALDEAFKGQSVTGELLQQRLQTAEKIRAALRAVHLSAHLEVTPLLTDEQKTQYAELRGYAGGHDGHKGHQELDFKQ